MTTTKEVKTSSEASVSDRRRPGRLEKVSPALIPMLRAGEQPADYEKTIEFDEPDQMAGARGVLVGAAISAPLWVGIAYLGRWLFT